MEHFQRCICIHAVSIIYHNCFTGCPKIKSRPLFHELYLKILKEVCLDRVTLHNVCDTKIDPIDNLLNELT